MLDPESFASACHEEAVSMLREAAAIPSPSHDEGRRVEWILRWCGANGLEAFSTEAKNVIIPIGDDGESLLDIFAAHTDVVFPDTTPLPVWEEDGKLHAPGAGDDTANFVSLLLFAREYAKRPSGKRGALFVCNSCEEGLGNLKGTREIFRLYGDRAATFTSFDTTLGGGVVTEAVGSERWKVTARTAGGHSFANFGAKSAIAEMAALVARLYSQTGDRNTLTTYNVGTITGGTSVNTIAQDCSVTYEYRSVSPSGLSSMRSRFLSEVGKAGGGGVAFETELIGERPAGQSRPDPHVENTKKLLEKHGYNSASAAASTDCNIPLSLSIPSVCFGLIKCTGAHTREEFVDLASWRGGLALGWDHVLTVTGA